MSVVKSLKGRGWLPFRRILPIVLCLMGVLLLSAVVISARGWLGPQSGEVTVILSGTGFDPFEVAHAPGQFNLKINNQSGAGQVTLRLYKRGQQEIVREVSVPAGSAEWTVPLDLAEGDYSLTEASNPAWLLYVKVR